MPSEITLLKLLPTPRSVNELKMYSLWYIPKDAIDDGVNIVSGDGLVPLWLGNKLPTDPMITPSMISQSHNHLQKWTNE